MAHFDRPNGQVAESVIVEPDGSADVGLILSRQVAHVSLDGRVEVLATMPLPADGGVNTPSVGVASVTGIERGEDGTLYFLYSAGDRHLTGLWKLPPGGEPTRIAALPAASFANGLARDNSTGNFYITDSTRGKVWQVRPHGGTATVWAEGPGLSPTHFFGANGVKVHNGAVWVSNIDHGTILRIPLTGRGTAGTPQVRASGLDSVDDFAFTGRGDQLLAALNIPSKVVLITPGRPDRTVLDQSDGLQNTTAVAVDEDTVYVSSGALTTGGDANLLTARLDRR
ncbi:hypothetical protein [Streptomyces sp. NBC_01429]|uniref:hypothetical protein n=1 Tax=Streptomyces sp. NBC_01429 TaxID=2903862 RepID=UPI002E2E3748|nr:hypothetical protein [Streptomyces sp. NBC_01429]